MTPRGARARAIGRSIAIRAAWLAVATILALGGAGLASGIERVPGTAARPELTWRGDAAIQPGFAGARTALDRISLDVEGLGRLGRDALASVGARDSAAIEAALADGNRLVLVIQSDVDDYRALLRDLPGIGPDDVLLLSTAARDRYDTLLGAIATTAELPTAWARLTAGSAAAIRLVTLLEEHDRRTAKAASEGRSRRYAEAVAELDAAKVPLDQARALRDVIANTSDVTTLDEWISRNATYDAALRDLYEALRTSGGRVTPKVTAAIAAEAAAKTRLPPDTRGLVVIMADFARGGLNQAVIGIEEARGELDAIIATLDEAATQPTP